jgi:hypothetical protein
MKRCKARIILGDSDQNQIRSKTFTVDITCQISCGVGVTQAEGHDRGIERRCPQNNLWCLQSFKCFSVAFMVRQSLITNYLFIYLFIYGLFNNGASSSHCIASND